MPLPHRSDFPGVRFAGRRLIDGFRTAPTRPVALPEPRPYAYSGDGSTVPDVPLTPAPAPPPWPVLCLHDAPADPWERFSAPPEWHRELAGDTVEEPSFCLCCQRPGGECCDVYGECCVCSDPDCKDCHPGPAVTQ